MPYRQVLTAPRTTIEKNPIPKAPKFVRTPSTSSRMASSFKMPDMPSFGVGGGMASRLNKLKSPVMDMMARGRKSTSGPTSRTVTNQTTKQNRSPELEAMMENYMGRLGGIREGTGEAYEGVSGALLDMMKYVADAARTRGSAAATGAGQAALASGLSPLEATALSGQQWQGALQGMYPQLAELRTQRAMVPVEYQKALAQLLTGAELPMMGQVASPYYQGVAGQTSTGTQDVFDYLAREQMEAEVKQAEQDRALEQEKMNLQAYLGQLGAQTDLQRAMLGLQGQLGAAEMGMRGQLGAARTGAQSRLGAAEMGAQSDIQRALLGLQGDRARAEGAARGAQAEARGDILNTLLKQQLMGEREAAEFERGLPLEQAQLQSNEFGDMLSALARVKSAEIMAGTRETPQEEMARTILNRMLMTGEEGTVTLPSGATVTRDIPNRPMRFFGYKPSLTWNPPAGGGQTTRGGNDSGSDDRAAAIEAAKRKIGAGRSF